MAGDVFEVDGVDELFEMEPSGFTKARNVLSTRLKKTGDKDAAKQVKKLRRPTKVAWALNQIVRHDPGSVDELLEATHAVREAQLAALEEGEPAALRDATSKRRRLISDLASRAAGLAGSTNRDDAAATLDAASLETASHQQLRKGRLTKTLNRPSGFDLDEMPEPRTKPRRRLHNRSRVKRLEWDLHRAERRIEQARDGVERAERRVTVARQRHGTTVR